MCATANCRNAQRVMNVVVKLLHPCRAAPGPGGLIPVLTSASLTTKFWAPAQLSRPCWCLDPAAACLRREKLFPLPLEESLWKFPPEFALNQDTHLIEPGGNVTAGMELCHCTGHELGAAGTWGQRARAGSTVLTAIASLRNSSYSHQYLFAQ